MNEIRPTDYEDELAKGRIALWLDKSDIEWIASKCEYDEQASEEERERCGRVRFRANAALHKAGAK